MNTEIIDRIIDHLRTQFMIHQEELKNRKQEELVKFDNRIGIYDAHDKEYGPREEDYMIMVSDSIVLDQENIEELMNLARESLEIFGLGQVQSLSAAQFLDDKLIDLKQHLEIQPDSIEKSEKMKKIENYSAYLGIGMGHVGVEGDVMCDLGRGAMFTMSKCAGVMEPVEMLLRIENNGLITIDTLQKEGHTTMNKLTEEALNGMTYGDLENADEATSLPEDPIK